MINENNASSKSVRPGKRRGIIAKILKRLLIFFLIALAVLAALYYYNRQVVPEQIAINAAAAGETNINNIDLTGKIDVKTGSFVENPYFSGPLDFTINLKDRRRFLKVTFFLGMDDPRIIPYIERRLPIVNDIIISTVQYKNVEDLQDILGIERLKSELLLKINNEVFAPAFVNSLNDSTKKPIRRILVTEFILQ